MNPILLSMSTASIVLVIVAFLFDECISFYMDSANFVGFLFLIPWLFSVIMTLCFKSIYCIYISRMVFLLQVCMPKFLASSFTP